MSKVSSEDVERIEFLEIVSSSKIGLKLLSKEQLQRLYRLFENKDYTNNIKIEKSKKELLEKIDNRLYDIVDGRIIL